MFCLRVKLMACGKECVRFGSLPCCGAWETLGQCAGRLARARRGKVGFSRSARRAQCPPSGVMAAAEPFPLAQGSPHPVCSFL